MRVLVCGGRYYDNQARLYQVLDDMHSLASISVIIAGAASGADHLAANWAKDRCVDLCEFPADWKTHGKAAGPIRNAQMLAEGRPDYVLAFFPAGRGTADMVRKAIAAGVAVREC